MNLPDTRSCGIGSCACLDWRVFGHVWPCPRAVRNPPPPDVAAQLLAAIKRIQEGQPR